MAQAAEAPQRGFEPLLEALPDGIVIVGEDGRIRYANRLVSQLSGYSPEELIGRPIEVLVPDATRPGHERHRAGYSAKPRARPMGTMLDTALQRKDGTVFPVDIALSPLSTEPELLVVAAVRDATERQQAQRRLQAVIEVTRLLMEGESEMALQRIAHHARVLAGAAQTMVLVPNPEGRSLAVRAVDGERADRLRGAALPLEGSLAGAALRSGHSINVPDARLDPRAHQPTIAAGNFGPVFCMPLQANGRSVALLEVADSAGAPPIAGERMTVVELFGNQAAVALEYIRVRQDLERLAVLEDRERIAKELHDGVIQELFAVGMTLQATEAKTLEPETVRARLAAAVESIDEIIRDLRNYIFGLRPGLLADRRLDEALRELAAEFERRTGIVAAVDIDPRVSARFANSSGPLVQIVREALSNVARHSSASTCRLSFLARGEQAVLEIDDDGKGLDGQRGASGGQGLRNMEERAASIGGRFHLESAPGQGSTVRVFLPL